MGRKQDWIDEYERLVKAAHEMLAWSKRFGGLKDLTPIERQANRSLAAYVRSALRDASSRKAGTREMSRRRRKLERAGWDLADAYLSRRIAK